jgi:hypothetical protein
MPKLPSLYLPDDIAYRSSAYTMVDEHFERFREHFWEESYRHLGREPALAASLLQLQAAFPEIDKTVEIAEGPPLQGSMSIIVNENVQMRLHHYIDRTFFGHYTLRGGPGMPPYGAVPYGSASTSKGFKLQFQIENQNVISVLTSAYGPKSPPLSVQMVTRGEAMHLVGKAAEAFNYFLNHYQRAIAEARHRWIYENYMRRSRL